MTNDIIVYEDLEPRILTIRGHRVILDADLAEMYEVETRALNQAVKRNQDRFPESFAFRLTHEEAVSLRSQTVILEDPASGAGSEGSNRGKHIKHLPTAFTEHGVLMAANVLRSERAAKVSVRIIESFIRLRSAVLSVPDLAKKIEAIEARLAGFQDQLDAFQQIVLPLLAVNLPSTRKIGFAPKK